VHIVRLADGTHVALPSLGAAPRAQIEAAGLVESWRSPDRRDPTGRVVFVPFAELPFD
jgi:hypothetical protein